MRPIIRVMLSFSLQMDQFAFSLKMEMRTVIQGSNIKIAQGLCGTYIFNIESRYAYNWYVWFWTQQVRHGSLTRQSSHRSSYKIHRRHRSVSSSIPPSLLSFLLHFRVTLWTLMHLNFETLATNYTQIRTLVIILSCYRFTLCIQKSKKVSRFEKKIYFSRH